MAKDKKMHLLAGFSIATLIGLGGFLLPYTKLWQALGLIAAVAIGAWKEWRDWRTGKGKPEWLDFWATCLGGVIGYLVIRFI